MAIPTKNIKKIQLNPNDETTIYEIVPEKISDGNGNVATLPDLNGNDQTLIFDVQAEGTSVVTNGVANITAQSLGLSAAMKFIGVSTTDPKISGATVSGVSTWQKGNVVIYKRSGESGYEEYVNLDGNNTNVSWELLGDADSYALNSIQVTGAGVLSGGGNLTQNRTITHNEVLGSAKSTADVYDIKIDKYGHISEATSSNKVVRTTANQGLTDTQKQNARDNIGAGEAVLIRRFI